MNIFVLALKALFSKLAYLAISPPPYHLVPTLQKEHAKHNCISVSPHNDPWSGMLPHNTLCLLLLSSLRPRSRATSPVKPPPSLGADPLPPHHSWPTWCKSSSPLLDWSAVLILAAPSTTSSLGDLWWSSSLAHLSVFISEAQGLIEKAPWSPDEIELCWGRRDKVIQGPSHHSLQTTVFFKRAEGWPSDQTISFASREELPHSIPSKVLDSKKKKKKHITFCRSH